MFRKIERLICLTLENLALSMEVSNERLNRLKQNSQLYVDILPVCQKLSIKGNYDEAREIISIFDRYLSL